MSNNLYCTTSPDRLTFTQKRGDIVNYEIAKKTDLELLLKTRSFYHTYQPIYWLSHWNLFGYEAFLRSDLIDNPEKMFRTARKESLLYELDTTSMYHAIVSYFHHANYHSVLFVNLFPSTMMHPSFQSFMEQCIDEINIPCGSIVLEINEEEEITDFDTLRDVIARMKAKGFRIALDDMGKGATSLQKMLELEPDIIKLDCYFASNLSSSGRKQKLIELFVEYCKSENAQLVLEGIERPEDLATAKTLGVSLGQGYLLGRDQRIETTR